jgi:predicted restriction endonuclease
MQIFDRDECRCRICGASPDTDRHATIEVHHIKPWEEGGITSPENLITLCKLCHDNIIYVDRKILYRKIGINFPLQNHLIFNSQNNYSFKQRTQLSHYMYNAVTLRIKIG